MSDFLKRYISTAFDLSFRATVSDMGGVVIGSDCSHRRADLVIDGFAELMNK